MMRHNHQRLAVLLVLAGMALRALTPLGYMPASADSGLLFELCPDQLPAGFEFAGKTAAHHHHHQDDSASSAASADLCDFGHLLISAMADAIVTTPIPVAAPTFDVIPASTATLPRRLAHAYLSRAPPA